jgi:hypothetical protein
VLWRVNLEIREGPQNLLVYADIPTCPRRRCRSSRPNSLGKRSALSGNAADGMGLGFQVPSSRRLAISCRVQAVSIRCSSIPGRLPNRSRRCDQRGQQGGRTGGHDDAERLPALRQTARDRRVLGDATECFFWLAKGLTGNDCNAEKSPNSCGNAAQNPAIQSSKCPGKWLTSVEPYGSRGSRPIFSEGTNRIRRSVRSIGFAELSFV